MVERSRSSRNCLRARPPAFAPFTAPHFIGMPKGTSVTMAIQDMAKANGVDFNKIQFVSLSPPDAVTALAKGMGFRSSVPPARPPRTPVLAVEAGGRRRRDRRSFHTRRFRLPAGPLGSASGSH
jgi:hypothetical protein